MAVAVVVLTDPIMQVQIGQQAELEYLVRVLVEVVLIIQAVAIQVAVEVVLEALVATS